MIVIRIFFVLIFSCITLYIANLAVVNNYDDNILYIQAYNQIIDLSLTKAYIAYKHFTGGSEIIYFYLNYNASSYIKYPVFILYLNIVFLLVFYKTLKKYFRNYVIIYLITLFTNFYLYVFLINTHKLKVALIFLMLFLLLNKFKKSMLVLSVLSHFQAIIVFIYYAVIILLQKIKDKKLFIINSKKINYTFLLISTIAISLFYDKILTKIIYYSDFSIPYRVILLIILYTTYLNLFKLKRTKKFFYPVAVIILILSCIIGGDRINFILMEIIFFTELNRSLFNNKYALLVVVPILVYNFTKLVFYINDGVGLV
jgi:hypothetical protein